MKKIAKAIVLIAIGTQLIACNKPDTKPSNDTSNGSAVVASTPAATAPLSKPVIDVGSVEDVAVTSTGRGVTPDAAVDAALSLAIKQVNGTVVDSRTATLNYAGQAYAKLDVETRNGSDSAKLSASLQSREFAQSVLTASSGVITSFTVNKVTAPTSKGGDYLVEIAAKVAKFKAPATNGKLKIVIAPLRSDKESFVIAGRATPASEVLPIIHQQIVDAVTQTGRFIVLDRQFDDEIQNELNLIATGQTNNANFAKIGNAASADIVWTGVVNEFSYEKYQRHLDNSDRDIVSYAGGWMVSQRMINLATRQVLQAATLKGKTPTTPPTTLSINISKGDTIKNMSADIVQKTTEAILLKIFPISVVTIEGNDVVLSQGGQAVKPGTRYMIYLLGKELKDPQTGLSLGQIESACCEVLIDRVTDKISYGTLENVKVKLDNVAPGALQVRELLTPKATIANLLPEPARAGEKGSRAVPKQESPVVVPAPTIKKDDW